MPVSEEPCLQLCDEVVDSAGVNSSLEVLVNTEMYLNNDSLIANESISIIKGNLAISF